MKPLVIFAYHRATAEMLSETLGIRLGLFGMNAVEVIGAIHAGESAVLMVQAYACSWRADCNVVVLDEVPPGPLRTQAHARGVPR